MTPKYFLFLVALFSSIVMANDVSEKQPLEGQTFSGKIRANGIYGIFAVRGTLSFSDGRLIWSVDSESESGAYSTNIEKGLLSFESHYMIENNETVQWKGTFDGEKISNVSVIWRRQPGDWVHDLFLPKVVTLTFTPD